MTRRAWVLAVTAWLGVVLAGSALTWIAINRAGQQVTSSSVFTGVTQSSSPTPRPSARPPKPRATPKPRRTGVPSAAPTQPSGAATSQRYTPPPARSEVRTWSGAPGSMTVSCSGSTARFVAASPNNGWQVERGDLTGDSIEVKFSKTGAQVQVQATCSGGIPAFQVDSSGGGDS